METQFESGHKIVILWDLIKSKLRPSEVNEMERLIGKELIENLEELRGELANLVQINEDMMADSSSDSEQESTSMRTNKQMQSSFFSEGKNSNFLTQELHMFIEGLQSKAAKIGLDEDHLIPMASKKDRAIYNYLKTQKADEVRSTRPSSALMDDRKSAMRSSFYSVGGSTMGDTMTGFNQKPKVVDDLNIKNILELSTQDQRVIEEIKKFMTQQEQEMEKEIESMQNLMLENAGMAAKRNREKQEKEEQIMPSDQDLRDYSNKLQNELLKSDQTLKIAALPGGLPSSSQSSRKVVKIQRKNSLPKIKGGPSSPVLQKLKVKKTGPGIDQLTLKNSGNSSEKKYPEGATKPMQKISLSRIKMQPIKVFRPAAVEEQIDTKTEKKPAPTSMYGLDISILKSLNMDNLIEEKIKQEEESSQKARKKVDPYEGKDYEELRKEISLKPTSSTFAVSRLREACKTYENSNEDSDSDDHL